MNLKITVYKITFCFIFLLTFLSSKAQEIWKVRNKSTFELNTSELNKKLALINNSNKKIEIQFPYLTGELVTFYIYDNAVLPKALARKFPQVHAYKGVAKINSEVTFRFTCIPSGIQATLFDGNQIWNLAQTKKTNVYKFNSDKKNKKLRDSFRCESSKPSQKVLNSTTINKSAKALVGDNRLRILRLAVTTSGGYSNFFISKNNLQGGSESQKKAAVISGIVTSINNINVVFERDLGVRLELIPDNDRLIFLDDATDPFSTNTNLDILFNEGAQAISDRLPESDYDIGHLLVRTPSNGGGYAFVGAICQSAKGNAVTGFSSPEGFFFDFTLFAHELGHQLGAKHTQNADCLREFPSVEPGSGTTIMGYSGACGSDDIQSESDPFFHSASIDQILPVLQNLDSNSNCGIQISTVNNALPEISSIPNYTIPVGIPFFLEANVIDANGDNLTYSWEQIDTQPGPSPPSPDSTVGPQFRVFNPTTNPRRDFPKNAQNSKWEVLPTVPRIMNFNLLVRDGRQGGVSISNEVQVSTINNSERFEITSPVSAIKYDQNAREFITWNVANTNLPPFNTENVSIELSYDGGVTYPVTLIEKTKNNGSAQVRIPIGQTSENAKIRVNAYENIFYTLTQESITITDVIRDDFPTLIIESEQDFSRNILIFRIKTSFPAPKDIIFFPTFSNADTNENLETEDEFTYSVDFNSGFKPLIEDQLTIKAGSSEIFIAVPLRSKEDITNTLIRVRLLVFAKEGTNNQSAVNTDFIIKSDNSIEDNISIITNPPSGKEVIFSSITFPTGGYEILIFDMTGKLVFQGTLNQRNQPFNLSNLSSGLYIARITREGAVGSKKLILL